MYGCDRMFPREDDSRIEQELVNAYREMRQAEQEDGATVERMTIEMAQNEFFTMIGWRAYEKATTT